MSEQITPERLFLQYAYPCLESNIMGKGLPQRMKDRIEDFLRGTPIDEKILKKVFAAAYLEVGKTPWTMAMVRQYFLGKHNREIARMNGICEDERDLCRVYEAEVVAIGDGCATVRYSDDKRRTVKNVLLGGLGLGDRVAIHHGYAVDILG